MKLARYIVDLFNWTRVDVRYHMESTEYDSQGVAKPFSFHGTVIAQQY